MYSLTLISKQNSSSQTSFTHKYKFCHHINALCVRFLFSSWLFFLVVFHILVCCTWRLKAMYNNKNKPWEKKEKEAKIQRITKVKLHF